MMERISYYQNYLICHKRKIIRNILIWTTILAFVLVVLDYFLVFSFRPFSIELKSNTDYKDHIPSYFFYGLMSTLGVIISFYIYLVVSSKEAKTIGEYLDIYNEILDDIRKGDEFRILSPAHQAGQKDSYVDASVKRKYDLNQELLLEKSRIATGEYAVLKYGNSELSTFSNNNLSPRTALIESFNRDPTNFSLMFKFLMKFSKQIKTKNTDAHTTTVQNYVHEAFLSLQKLKSNGLTIKTIDSEDYFEAPLVLIISERIAYFGLYKLIDGQSNAVVRGIKITDKDGIETLELFYKAMSAQFH